MKRNIKAKVRRLAAIAAALALAVTLIPVQEAEAAKVINVYVEVGDEAVINSEFASFSSSHSSQDAWEFYYGRTYWGGQWYDHWDIGVDAIAPGSGTLKLKGLTPSGASISRFYVVTVNGIDGGDFSLSLGGSKKLKFYGNSLYPVKWKSKDTSVAKVNKSGKVTGVGVGTTEIVAKCQGKEYAATVTVQEPWLNATKIEMLVGEERTLMAVCAEGCTWASQDDAVASVAGSGDSASVTVTGESAGSTAVTCGIGGMTLTCEVDVVESWGTDEDGNELKRAVLFDLFPYDGKVPDLDLTKNSTYDLSVCATFWNDETDLTFISPSGERYSAEDYFMQYDAVAAAHGEIEKYYEIDDLELGAWCVEGAASGRIGFQSQLKKSGKGINNAIGYCAINP